MAKIIERLAEYHVEQDDDGFALVKTITQTSVVNGEEASYSFDAVLEYYDPSERELALGAMKYQHNLDLKLKSLEGLR
jgi:hypothetical protein